MNRRGFSLAELIIVLSLIGWMLLGVTLTLRTAARTTDIATRELVHARDLSTVSALLQSSTEWAASTDLLAGVVDTLSFDLRLGEAAPCASGASSVTVPLSPSPWSRLPVADRDQLLLLTQVEPAQWERRPLTLVHPAACPDLRPAIALETTAGAPALWLRVVTPVRMRAYASGGSRWLGLEERGGGGSIQPFAGPLAGPLHATLVTTRLYVQMGGSPVLTLPLDGAR